jgi:hypothetical protein
MRDPFSDAVFGPLRWDEGFLAWKGQLEWSPGLRVEVLLALGKDRAAGLRVARESLDWVRAHEPQVRRLVAEDLSAWCSDFFRPEDPVGEARFLQDVELHQLRLEEDGSLWVLYHDGHLFGGHVFWAEFGADKAFRGTSVD